jgi:hypothetical protein
MIRSDVKEFEPVRLHLSNGQTIDILNREHFLISPSVTAVLVDDVIVHVSNVHINKVEPLSPARA